MVPAGIADVAPWRDWSSAADDVLRFLAQHVGWDLWLITQVVGDTQVVLRANPPDAVRAGLEIAWEDSFCRQMIEGNGPRLATVTAAVPAYAARSGDGLGMAAAYVGVPLVRADGSLFGTLCGLAVRAQPRSVAREMVVVETSARMLSTLMAAGMTPPVPEDG